MRLPRNKLLEATEDRGVRRAEDDDDDPELAASPMVVEDEEELPANEEDEPEDDDEGTPLPTPSAAAMVVDGPAEGESPN